MYTMKFLRCFYVNNYTSKMKCLQPKDFTKVLRKSEQRGLPEKKFQIAQFFKILFDWLSAS
jgi:hypothetical protein